MKRDIRTPTFWTSADPPPMLPRGQLDLPLVQAQKVEPRCEFCKRLPATVESMDGDGFACDGCRDQRDGDFGLEAGVAWRAVR